VVGKVQPGLSWDIGTHCHRARCCLHGVCCTFAFEKGFTSIEETFIELYI